MAVSRSPELTDEDLAIIHGRSAIAVFMAAVAASLQGLAEHPAGDKIVAELQEMFLAALSENLQKCAAPQAPFPMPNSEVDELRRMYRVFRAFYLDPNALVNLPRDSTQH